MKKETSYDLAREACDSLPEGEVKLQFSMVLEDHRNYYQSWAEAIVMLIGIAKIAENPENLKPSHLVLGVAVIDALQSKLTGGKLLLPPEMVFAAQCRVRNRQPQKFVQRDEDTPADDIDIILPPGTKTGEA